MGHRMIGNLVSVRHTDVGDHRVVGCGRRQPDQYINQAHYTLTNVSSTHYMLERHNTSSQQDID